MATQSVNLGPDYAAVKAIKRSGLARRSDLGEIIDQLIEALQINLQIAGASRVERTDDGIFIEIDGSLLAPYPWKGTLIDGDFWVMGGSYNDLALDACNAGDGDGWVWIKATWDVSDTGSGFLISATLSDAEIQSGSSVPSSDALAGIWYIPLVQFADGEVLSQAQNTSITAIVCDDGTGNERGRHSAG